MEIPDVPRPLLEALTQAAAGERCALVGGVVRDLLLHRHHEDPWRGLPDLDIVVEGRAADLVQRLPHALECQFGFLIPLSLQEHGAFGTFELELELPAEFGGTWLLDVASARQEKYPEPGENPTVRLGSLRDDLARRDFTVNAMALELVSGELLDLHHGQSDLSARQLNLLHPSSLRDDPTRWVRGARYAARLGFQFSTAAQQQALSTLSQWPWIWLPGDDPGQAPPALGTRLRMELELLFQREPWRVAVQVLQQTGGLALLDTQLQQDASWAGRLHWAQRLAVPLLPALVAGAADPLGLAERLQLPHRQHKLLVQLQDLKNRLNAVPTDARLPSWWAEFLEAPGLSSEAVALAISLRGPHWHSLLRWWGRWRHVRSPIAAQVLMKEEGLRTGKDLGSRLNELRKNEIDRIENLSRNKS
ncbi:CCA tRNA nucleotidyltransferase [Synechococcus sp. W4D4]|uniref:CCA tRNA nucleotidyltransferase n=1 Tax=Synechococcus sp. W4D4 TaxID=3392294 RepID=UPI0039EB2BAE